MEISVSQLFTLNKMENDLEKYFIRSFTTTFEKDFKVIKVLY